MEQIVELLVILNTNNETLPPLQEIIEFIYQLIQYCLAEFILFENTLVKLIEVEDIDDESK